MKRLIIIVSCFFISINLYSQPKVEIIRNLNNFRLTQNLTTGKYNIINNNTNEKLQELNYVNIISSYYQVLDSKNRMFFINEEWDIKKEVNDFDDICIMESYYLDLIRLSIELNGEFYEICERPIIIDYENESTFEKASNLSFKINKNLVDEIFFINGKSKIQYQKGDLLNAKTDPRTIIILKGKKYFTFRNSSVKYDYISTNQYPFLRTKNNDLHGLFGIIEPKYKRISEFNYYLAKAILPSGELVFIDLEGTEYKSTQ